LQRADVITRRALDQTLGDAGKYFDVYSGTTFADRELARMRT